MEVSDGTASDACAAHVTVEDNTAPVIDSAVVSPSVIGPPNHKMHPVVVAVEVTDTCDVAPTCRISGVSSNEAPDGEGDGDTSPDWEITGALSADLRAERAGGGAGRLYTLDIECTDASDNSASEQVTVSVAHDSRKKK